MKFLIVLAVFGVGAVLAEAPAAPYAPRGWRPQGPSFDLPTETNQPTQEFGPESKAEVDITEQEIQYNGEIATTESTTPFLDYGPPNSATDLPDDQATTYSTQDDLSVQGLPGTEAAAEFRNFNRFEARRSQRLRQQQPQKRAQLRQQQSFNQNQFNRQQFNGFNSFQQPQFPARLQSSPQITQARFNQNQKFASQSFGRLTVPQRQTAKARALPVFNQRFTSQRQTLDSYGAPAQTYGAPGQSGHNQEYGPPKQEFQPPTQGYGAPPQEIPQEEPADLPQEEPEQTPQENEETNEPTDEENEAGPNVAISTAVATSRYVNGRSGRLLNARNNAKNANFARFQQLNEPVYMYNQFGQLIRIQ